MKISLINIPYSGSQVKSFPLGLASIVAYLQKYDHDIYVLDAELNKMGLDEIHKWAQEHPADLVAINATSYSRFDAIDLAERFKQDGVRWTLFGGHHFTHLPVETLQHYPFVDFVISGPAETALVKLCHVLENEHYYNCRSINGLTYRLNGDIVRASVDINENFQEPTKLPFGLFEVDKYSTFDELLFLYSEKHHQNVEQGKTITYFLSRGCPYSCYFCANVKYWQKISFKELDDATNEIQYLIEKYGITHFIMIDPTFTIKRNHTIAFCQRLREKNINITFFCSTRVNLVDEELLDLLVESGLKCIQFGIETGSPDIIRNICKGIELKDVRQKVKMCIDRGLIVKGYFMFGHPGETEEDVMKTITFSRELYENSGELFVPVSMFTDIYPGSQLERIAKQNGKLNPGFNWFDRIEYPQNRKINMGWTMVPIYENETCKIERILELTYHNFPQLLNPSLYEGYDRVYRERCSLETAT